VTSEVKQDCLHLLYPPSIFSIDRETCILSVNVSLITKHTSYLLPHLSQMSPDPVVFHGNGRGKEVTKLMAPVVRKCLLKKYKIASFSNELIIDQ
jgi:hypothetical protein